MLSDGDPGLSRDDELNRALDRGELTELPPNVPPGMLGEVGFDVRKVDDFRPTLSAGIIQESTTETRWLTIALLYLLLITAPVAVWLVWRDPHRSLRVKLIATGIGILGYGLLYWSRTSLHV
jgi:hypothetical protein